LRPESRAQVHAQVHAGGVPSLPLWWHGEVQRLVAGCLHADPAQRPAFNAVLGACERLAALAEADESFMQWLACAREVVPNSALT
jgi:hypothetical protein